MAYSPARSDDIPRIQLRSPAQLAAAIPYLVGFHPVESLVVVGLVGEPRHVVVTMRVDLPPRGRPAGVGGLVAGHLVRAGADSAFVVVCSDAAGADAWSRVVTAVEDATADVGVAVLEALSVHRGRWHSYRCRDTACCPTEGRPVEQAEIGALAAAAAYTGRVVHPSRDHMVDSLAPLPVDLATTEAFARARDDRDGGPPRGGRSRSRARTAADTRRLLRAAVERRAETCAALPVDELARLTIGLADVHVRDGALQWLGGPLEHAAESLWVELTRRSERSHVAPPATLLAVHAYLRGDGAYARTALDVALAGEPGYPFAGLLAQAIDNGLPPHLLRSAVEASRDITAGRPTTADS